MKNLGQIVTALVLVCSTHVLAACIWPVASATPQSLQEVGAIGDGGLLSGKPCAPPCFLGIIPGQTTESEAVDILKTRGMHQSCELINNERFGGVRGLICFPPGLSVSFEYRGKIVDAVGFFPAEPVTVQEVLAAYGEPDAVIVTPDGIPETPYTQMLLRYGSISATLRLVRQQGSGYSVEPSTRVAGVGYSARDHSGGSQSAKRGWQGYGDYDINVQYE